MTATPLSAPPATGAHLVVIGAGGNIGSHLVPLLARMDGVARLTLIDRDVYELKNLSSQDAGARDVGRTKVVVQARRARRANPALHLSTIHAAVEGVPLGVLRADVILTGLDSRRARQYVNEASRRLGVPWIDGGVFADERLARVSTYSNTADGPCMECTWGDAHYAALEQSYPCAAGAGDHPTGAPAWLGALAAALQAAECSRALDVLASGGAIDSKELIVDARHAGQLTTTLRRNHACRLDEHSPWRMEQADDTALDSSLAYLVAADDAHDTSCAPCLTVAGRRFQTGERCAECGLVRRRVRLARPTAERRPRCARCGGPVHATSIDLTDALCVADLPAVILRRTLRSLGVRPNDILSLSNGNGERHLAIVENATRPEGQTDARSDLQRVAR